MIAMTMNVVRTLQARCASLGFWPGPIDGSMGPRTREAEKEARASQKAKGLPFMHPSGLTRIHWHWTGGRHHPNAKDLASYHILFAGAGRVIEQHSHTKILSHTLGANSGAISLSACAMFEAQERPFAHGPEPLTSAQIGAIARQTAILCKAYDIPVSPWSTLSHSEIQPTLGVQQRQKWDINWLPGMERPSDPVDVGNRLRALVRAQLEAIW